MGVSQTHGSKISLVSHEKSTVWLVVNGGSFNFETSPMGDGPGTLFQLKMSMRFFDRGRGWGVPMAVFKD